MYATGSFTTVGALNTVQGPQRIVVHGNGATLSGGSADYVTIDTAHPLTIRDLQVINPVAYGTALRSSDTLLLERVRVTGHNGLAAGGQVTAKDLDVTATGALGTAVFVTGNLIVDRARIKGGSAGIGGRGVIDATNVLVTGTAGAGVSFDGAQGTLRFVTIGRTNYVGGGGIGARCVASSIVFESSIIWDSSATANPNVEGCDLENTIVGPVAVSIPGALNTPPLFVDEFAGNLHITASSPARDAVDAGPPTDFEGEPRPRGVLRLIPHTGFPCEVHNLHTV